MRPAAFSAGRSSSQQPEGLKKATETSTRQPTVLVSSGTCQTCQTGSCCLLQLVNISVKSMSVFQEHLCWAFGKASRRDTRFGGIPIWDIPIFKRILLLLAIRSMRIYHFSWGFARSSAASALRNFAKKSGQTEANKGEVIVKADFQGTPNQFADESN